MPVVTLTDKHGKDADLKFDMSLYKRAADENTSVRVAARKLAQEQGVAWNPAKGDLLEQMFAASDLFRGQVPGVNGLTIADLQKMELADGFRRGDGSEKGLGARLLFPQFILETLRENALKDDGGDIIAQWNSMVALTNNVNGPRAEQPTINTSGPEESRSGRIAQLAEPETMVSITTGQNTYKIPTKSIGLVISDEARQATTVDLVRIVMEAQARGDRIRRIQEQLKAMVNGDSDLGMSALPVTKAGTLDSAITENGTVTKKAYLKWLYQDTTSAALTRVLTGLDEALTLDDALTSTNRVDPGKIPTYFNGVNLGIAAPSFTLFDSSTFGAGVMVGLDPRYAIQRFVNVNASYEAVEDYVMRRATAFRVDYGEMATRLYDDAWSVLSFEKA